MFRKKNLPEVEKVELKSHFGLRPGLCILFSALLLLLVLFFLFGLLPGIVKGGRYVSFTSPLSDVGVYVDGIYTNSSEGAYTFIPSGEHTFSYVKEGMTFQEEKVTIDHPVLFTLFRRPTLDVEISVPESQKEMLWQKTKQSYVNKLNEESRILSYDNVFRYEDIYQKMAKDNIALNAEDSELWDLSSSFITTEEMLADYKSAAGTLPFANDSALVEELFNNAGEIGKERAAYQNVHLETEDGFSFVPAGTYRIGRSVSRSYPEVAEMGIDVSTDGFYISNRMVSESEFAEFLHENPSWGRENKDNLIREGLVDEHYLDGMLLSTSFSAERPVRNISYYAAMAYTEWKSKKDGVDYYLPSSEEWEIAALLSDGKISRRAYSYDDGESTPYDLLGGLWEFTRTPFVPLSRYLGKDIDEELLPDIDVIVKGGSYIDEEADKETIGVVMKKDSMEYLGMRLVKYE